MSPRWLADFITAMLDGPPDDTLLVGSDFVLPLAGEVCPGRAIAREITARDSAASGSEITLDQARMEFLVGSGFARRWRGGFGRSWPSCKWS